MLNKDPSSTAPSEGGQIQTKVHEAAEQLRSSATQRVESVRDSAESARARAAERVRKLGGAVRKIGEHMRVEEQNYIADRASDASQRLESVADYIAQTEITGLMRDAGTVARKQPALVFGGTFLLGLAAGRFLKQSGAEAQMRQPSALPRTGGPAAGAYGSREATSSSLSSTSSTSATSSSSRPASRREAEPQTKVPPVEVRR